MTITDTNYTSVPTDAGTLWIYGWRETRWATARFTIERDESRHGGPVRSLTRNADWQTAWHVLAPIIGLDTEAVLRAALPQETT